MKSGKIGKLNRIFGVNQFVFSHVRGRPVRLFVMQMTINLESPIGLPLHMTKIFIRLHFAANPLFVTIPLELGGIRTTLRFATNSLFVTIRLS